MYRAGATIRPAAPRRGHHAALASRHPHGDDHLRGTPGGPIGVEVIEIYQQPTLAQGEQIIAAPTLIKKLPAPLRRFVGSRMDKEKILVGLDLIPPHS
jgi:hypothetical protein